MALVLAPPIGAQGSAEPGAAVRFEGAGTWRPAGGDATAANASWLVVDGRIEAFRIEANGTRTYCYEVVPPDALAADDALCAARQENDTVTLQRVHDGAASTGTFASTQRFVLIGSTEEPDPVPGFVVAFLAALFLTTSVILLVLYVQERRVAHYLVRRLYEETKGRLPADWPENLRQQWIARVFVRGKN